MANRAARRRAERESRRVATKRRDPVMQRDTPPPSALEPGSTEIDAPPTSAVEPEALVVTHWFDPGSEGGAETATVRVTGRRVDGPDAGTVPSTFSRDEAIAGIVRGSGPIALTTRVHGLAPGTWEVRAEILAAGSDPARPAHGRSRSIPRARWSWRRWSLSDAPDAPVRTRWEPIAPLAPAPAMLLGSWTVLGLLAAFVGLVSQALFLERDGITVERFGLTTFLAVAIGLIAAKVWYAFLHPGPWPRALLGGWAVDGFLAAGLVVAVVSALASGLPVGVYLDDTAPGLFLAVAIGRVGCFLAACCEGRLTGSRWGIWSSDRRVGARRVPTQLLESLAGLLLAAVSALLVLVGALPVRGSAFLVAIAIYAVVRQASLRLRAERRTASWRRAGSVVMERS